MSNAPPVPTTAALPPLPALVPGTVVHTRRGPVAHRFRHRSDLWLVDLDALPRLPWYLRPVAGFSARHHLGGTGPSASPDLRTNVERFLSAQGAEVDRAGRILMLANARTFGYVFDPITVFWCFGADGALRHVIAEVHNTYGDRHAYLLVPDADGRARVDKAMHVSPFNDGSGSYELGFRLDGTRVAVTATLERDGHEPFLAGFSGRPIAATPGAVARSALRRPLMPLRAAALIRLHAAWLWARGLPVSPRPAHHPQEGV